MSNYRRIISLFILIVFFMKFWNYFLYYKINIREEFLIQYPFHPRNRPLRVLSYNVFLRPPMISHCHGDYKNERLRLITKVFPYFDIILIQEMYTCLNFRCSSLINQANKTGLSYHYCTYSPSLMSRHLANNALLILSRYPILSTDYINFTNYGSYDSIIEKGADYVKIRIGPDLCLHTFNTHLQSSYARTDPIAKKIRHRQLGELRSFVKSKVNQSEPLICGGDFNINANDQEEKQTLYNFMSPYVDTHLNCTSPTFLVPYDSSGKEITDATILCKKCCQNFKNTSSDKLRLDKQRLDYMFYNPVNPRMKLTRTQVVPFYIQNPKLDFHLLSDHFALYSEFQIN